VKVVVEKAAVEAAAHEAAAVKEAVEKAAAEAKRTEAKAAAEAVALAAAAAEAETKAAVEAAAQEVEAVKVAEVKAAEEAVVREAEAVAATEAEAAAKAAVLVEAVNAEAVQAAEVKAAEEAVVRAAAGTTGGTRGHFDAGVSGHDCGAGDSPMLKHATVLPASPGCTAGQPSPKQSEEEALSAMNAQQIMLRLYLEEQQRWVEPVIFAASQHQHADDILQCRHLMHRLSAPRRAVEEPDATLPIMPPLLMHRFGVPDDVDVHEAVAEAVKLCAQNNHRHVAALVHSGVQKPPASELRNPCRWDRERELLALKVGLAPIVAFACVRLHLFYSRRRVDARV
jgi:hypothetical protein